MITTVNMASHTSMTHEFPRRFYPTGNRMITVKSSDTIYNFRFSALNNSTAAQTNLEPPTACKAHDIIRINRSSNFPEPLNIPPIHVLQRRAK